MRSLRSLLFQLRYGFWREDCWSLDLALAKWILPRLQYLAENNHGYPGALSEEEWLAILYKLIDGFELFAREDYVGDAEQWAYINDCLDLFREFFFDLWD